MLIKYAAIMFLSINLWAGLKCPVERGRVKDLEDADVSKIDWQPKSITVAELVALTPPVKAQLNKLQNRRFAPQETSLYVVEALLIGVKVEKDNDIHIVIADSKHPSITMIAEVPNPNCAKNAAEDKRKAFAETRREITQLITPSQRFYRFKGPVPVTLYGVGFFDFKHGQTGVAPNAIELHPVIHVTVIHPK